MNVSQLHELNTKKERLSIRRKPVLIYSPVVYPVTLVDLGRQCRPERPRRPVALVDVVASVDHCDHRDLSRSRDLLFPEVRNPRCIP